MGFAVSSFYAHSTITVIAGLLGIAEQGSIKVITAAEGWGRFDENFHAEIELVPAGMASIGQNWWGG